MGEFKATRLFDYSFHHDLNTNHLALIDLFDQVYLWIGKNAKSKDIELGCDVALSYIEKAPDGRKKNKVWSAKPQLLPC